MSYIQLPSAYEQKLSRMLTEISSGQKSYRDFGGKKIQSCPSIVSIPLGRRFRALFLRTEEGLEFRECLTHEAYNKMNFIR